MLKKKTDDLQRDLMDRAENRFGEQRAREIQPELEVMAEQLAILRSTPVEIQDEP